ncbi:MAG: YesL family protein [Lachnospiraceae bacterium]|nr:YesL family protein [Lachnospiraceae bacterium]
MTEQYMNNPVIRVLNRCTDLVVLNLLFLLCSLPIVTIGAALSGMYTVTLRSIRYGDGYVIPTFFKGFKESFRQATISWLITLGVGVLLFVDVRFWSAMDAGVVGSTMMMVSIAVGILFLMVASWAFPLIAKMEDSLGHMWQNALKMAVGYFFPYTIVCVGLPVVACYLAYINGPMLMLMLILGFATIAYCCSFFFYRVFSKHITEESLGPEDVLYPGDGASRE